MLTRELLEARVREGILRPSFIDAGAKEPLALAEQLLALAREGIGATYESVEESLQTVATAAKRPKVARGLVKLILDRVEVETPSEDAMRERLGHFQAASEAMRALAADATLERFEHAVAPRLSTSLTEVRARLHADLPARRRIVSFEALAPRALLDRYNLALAQGPLLEARRLTLTCEAPELSRIRKVLRWLKFTRLVAEVRREGKDWTFEIEGPGAVLAMQKKYGLQLAQFLTIVPALERWRAEAEVTRRGTQVTLALDHTMPLVSPHSATLAHIPPEVRALSKHFEDEDWALELSPLPRHVGAKGICVPDFLFRHRTDGREVALELFHPWHRGQLSRRLTELSERPDPLFLLGVERSLVKSGAEAELAREHPQVLLFHAFPSAQRLRERLARL